MDGERLRQTLATGRLSAFRERGADALVTSVRVHGRDRSPSVLDELATDDCKRASSQFASSQVSTITGLEAGLVPPGTPRYAGLAEAVDQLLGRAGVDASRLAKRRQQHQPSLICCPAKGAHSPH